jgi:hypothetical protein
MTQQFHVITNGSYLKSDSSKLKYSSSSSEHHGADIIARSGMADQYIFSFNFPKLYAL